MNQTNPVVFLKQVRAELGKVVWPSRTETVRLTLVVIGVTVAVGIFVGGLDILLVKITELVMK